MLSIEVLLPFSNDSVLLYWAMVKAINM